jgi:hypothetical protein
MLCLSIADERINAQCANSIFLLADPDRRERATLTFEVLEANAEVLAEQTRKLRKYDLEG